ncbi:MAG: ABC transporter substrate-binding protein [Oscillospiraceae bacterium]|nr:ABC transporter substrate-binding protein [Oscillospiraceae bacterium]MDD4368764.1 ABC transporter substrate-binding protein [Oscillospiraceae bacterium]
MLKRPTLWTRLLALALSGLLALTACGSADSPGSSAAQTTRAATETQTTAAAELTDLAATTSETEVPGQTAEASQGQSGSAAEDSSAGQTTAFTDDTGRDLTLPADLTRIAPSGAMAQMFILALAPDLLVSIAAEYSDQAQAYIDPAVLSLPVIGAFYGDENLNLEEIASLGAQVVIDMGETKESITEDMNSITDATAIPAVHIDATLESTGEAFRKLGKLLGREEQAEKLAAYFDDTYSLIQDVMQAVGEDNKVSTLYLLGDQGQHVIATGSFHAEVLNLMTNNLAVVDDPSSKGSGNETDLEQIMLWNPDVILFAPDSIYATVAEDPAWQNLTAITTGRYYEVPFGPYNWMGSPPSINRYLGMLWLGKLLYPEQATYDLYEQVQTYYQLMYQYDLTQEVFAQLTAKALPQVAE